jgi:hypothetical protein
VNSTLDALERSILSDNDIQNIESLSAPSLTERHFILYFIGISLFSLTAYAFIFAFPFTTIVIALNLPYKIISATSYIDVALIISEIFIASLCCWISILLYKVKLAKPSGRPLAENEAPQLIKLINDLQYEHNISKIHTIKVTNKFELNIIRTPKTGFPLLFSNTLIIGLPLMQCLSSEQFKIRLLTEFFHLQNRFKRPSSWFYFQRETWSQYRIEYHASWKSPHAIMRIFFSWYAPLYKVLSQGMVRKEKLLADVYTLGSIDKVSLVDMISISGISQHYLDNIFWPHLYSKAYKHKTPPYLPYASIERDIQTRLNNEISQSWIDQAIKKKSEHSSEPSLHQRLSNIELQRVLLPSPVMQSSASHYLGETLDLITQQMDKIWLMTHKFDWQQKYKKGQEEQKELAELGAQALSGLISDTKTWEYILLVKKYIEVQSQIPLFKHLLKINTRDARIRFDIGRTLLNHLDADGIPALENAMQLDPNYTVISCQLITKYCVATGDSKSAQAYRRKALAYQVEAA